MQTPEQIADDLIAGMMRKIRAYPLNWHEVATLIAAAIRAERERQQTRIDALVEALRIATLPEPPRG